MDRSRSTLAIQKALTEAITLGGLPAPPPAPPPPAQVVPQAPYQPALPPPIQKPPSPNGRNLELVFVHDCRNHGCNVPQCVLCKHNPNKRCQGNFAHKYWVGDKLLAKCEGEIAVELIDSPTGQSLKDNLSNYHVELCILDGNKYNTRVREAGEQRIEILDECEVLSNQKGEPLLIAAAANNDATSPRLRLKFSSANNTVPLKEVKVTESSESVLAGTKRPPFRLVVRALIAADGRRANIRPAVSEEFVVVTKRTKNLKKQDIPSLDDPISKLNHIGKETVKKLNELKASAEEAQLDLPVPPELYRVTKVREFQKLARNSEADGHLQQKLKQLLKLSKEKWDAACEHAKIAVQVDNRMRAWYLPNMSLGLLYTCTLGDIKPDCPVALVSNHNHDGADFMEVIPTENQVPAQRDQVRATCAQAVKCWWSENHEGWMIFTLGNRHFQTLEEIIQYSQTEGAAVNAPMAPAMDAPMYAAPPRSKRHMPEDGNTGSGGSSDDPNKQHAHPDGIAIYGQQPTGGYRQPNDNDRSMAGQWGRDEPMAGHRGPTGMQGGYSTAHPGSNPRAEYPPRSYPHHGEHHAPRYEQPAERSLPTQNNSSFNPFDTVASAPFEAGYERMSSHYNGRDQPYGRPRSPPRRMEDGAQPAPDPHLSRLTELPKGLPSLSTDTLKGLQNLSHSMQQSRGPHGGRPNELPEPDLDHEDFRAGLVSHAPPAKRRRDSSPQRYSDAQHDAQARGGWERQTEPQRDSQPVHFDARDMAQEAVAGAAQAHRQADQDRELLMSDMAAANRPRTPARDGLSKDAQHAQPAAA